MDDGNAKVKKEWLISLPHRFGKGDLTRFQVEFNFLRRAEDSGPVVVELVFPTGDDDRRQTVADQVHARAAHIHELVDAEDDGDADGAEAVGEKAVGARLRRRCGGCASGLAGS